MTGEVAKMTRLQRAALIAKGRRLGASQAARDRMEVANIDQEWRAHCPNCGPLRGTLRQLRAHKCGEPTGGKEGR
jgi:hypothetical protein